MSITLDINKELWKSNNSDVEIHYIPASIDGSGPADVQKYFSQYTSEDNGILTNSFRGFPVNGCTLAIPDGYIGIIFQESQKPLDDDADRTFKATDMFDSLTYWNYDKVPSKADPFKQCLDIIPISEALTQDITLEEIEKEMEEYKKEVDASEK